MLMKGLRNIPYILKTLGLIEYNSYTPVLSGQVQNASCDINTKCKQLADCHLSSEPMTVITRIIQ